MCLTWYVGRLLGTTTDHPSIWMATSFDLGILSMLEISRTDTNFRLSVACGNGDKEEPVLSMVFSEGATELVLTDYQLAMEKYQRCQ